MLLLLLRRRLLLLRLLLLHVYKRTHLHAHGGAAAPGCIINICIIYVMMHRLLIILYM
eukprot:COSAG06_NODE_122_length_23062_cov_43.568990_11_plen_58_part_00